MEKIDAAKFNLATVGFNAGMIGFGLMEGEPDIALLNATLMPVNLGFAVKNSEDELREFRRSAPEKAFGAFYDSVLKDRVEQKVEEAADRTSLEGGRHSHWCNS